MKNGFNCGDDSCIFEYTDHAIWKIKDEDVSAELHVYDYHTPVDIYPKKGALGEDVAPNHMEVAARVEGELTIGGPAWVIDSAEYSTGRA